MAKKKETEVEAVTPSEPKFQKADILTSKQFTAIQKDFLKVYLEDKKYSVSEAKALLDKKMKEAVK